MEERVDEFRLLSFGGTVPLYPFRPADRMAQQRYLVPKYISLLSRPKTFMERATPSQPESGARLKHVTRGRMRLTRSDGLFASLGRNCNLRSWLALSSFLLYGKSSPLYCIPVHYPSACFRCKPHLIPELVQAACRAVFSEDLSVPVTGHVLLEITSGKSLGIESHRD